MFHDPQHPTAGTMTSEVSPAPIALAAGQVDFAYDTLANPRVIVRVHHFSDKFMPGRALKTVVSALQLQIRVADDGAD